MSKEKQIEEMAQFIWYKSRPLSEEDAKELAEHLYNEGYRKQNEGEWIYQEYSMGHYVGKCSLCECEADMTNYCPNCGAKMKGD